MVKMHKVIWMSYVVVCILCTACSVDSIKPNYGNYPDAIGEIMVLKCAQGGCHNTQSADAASGLDLSTWQGLFKGSKSGSAVIPFSSKFSSLCYFVNTYSALGATATPVMPLNQSPLSFKEVNVIKTWIDQGAPDIKGQIAFSDPFQSYAYVVNQGCDVVTVIDRKSGLPIRYVEVGNKPGPDIPHQVKVSPDGKFWYVVFLNNSILQQFDAVNNSLVAEIPLCPSQNTVIDWNTLVINEAGNRAYAVSWSNNGKIAAVDLKSRSLLHFTSGLYQPHGICLSPDESQLLITCQTGNFIYEMDTALVNYRSIVLDSNISFRLDPHDIQCHPDNNDIWISCQHSNEVRVYEWPAWNIKSKVQVGIYPQELCFSKVQNAFYVSCTQDPYPGSNMLGSVVKIDARTFFQRKLYIGYQPHGIIADDENNMLWVVSRNLDATGPLPHHSAQCSGRNGFLNAVDLNRFIPETKRVELSVDPYFISIKP